MEASCPIPTPTKAIYSAILDRAQRAMLDTIFAASVAAHATAAAELRVAGLDETAHSPGFFTSVAHQGASVIDSEIRMGCPADKG